MIEGGYYIKARKIQDSEISNAPPHVREIWDWLIKEAYHKDFNGIKRGSLFTSLSDIADGLRWYVGYRKEVYSKSKCEMAMNWLRKRGMITTAKTTRGMIITICKYDVYQDPKNYETNNEKSTKPTRKEQWSDTIDKNGKNDKNKEEDTNSDFDKNQVDEDFENFRKEYPGTKRGYETEFENFKKKVKDFKEIKSILYDRLQDQINQKKIRSNKNLFVPQWKNLQTYINNRGWEEEFNINENEKLNKNRMPNESDFD